MIKQLILDTILINLCDRLYRFINNNYIVKTEILIKKVAIGIIYFYYLYQDCGRLSWFRSGWLAILYKYFSRV